MQIIIDLSDAQVQALEDYLVNDVIPITNPVSGNISNRPRHANVEAFILFQTSIYVGNAMQMFPPISVQADMIKIREAQQRIAELARPVSAAAAKV